MSTTVSDHIVEILQEWGVDTVFGLPGDGINGLVEAFRKAKDRIRYVHCRHEETAALAACAYAKFSGRLGVCFSTAAPGAVHLLNGLYDAKIDGAPVLALTGMTYHDLIGTHYLQDINQDYLYQDVAIYNQRLMARRMSRTWSTSRVAPRCRTRPSRMWRSRSTSRRCPQARRGGSSAM